jgi:hypothetical protein
VLAFGFTEKRQFAAKTDRNSVFLDRKADILDRLHIVIPFVSFYSFKKIQILAQNPKGLGFSFTEKWQFAAKTDQNSVFLGHKTQILNCLHIMVPYISFYGF